MPNARLQVLKCALCGNIVEMLRPSTGTLVCCSQPMTLLKENTTDAAKEKHVPVIERTADSLKVKVGSIPHPMEAKHFIEWIEVITPDGRVIRQELQPGQAPVAEFCDHARVVVREYCNLHGLWQAEG